MLVRSAAEAIAVVRQRADARSSSWRRCPATLAESVKLVIPAATWIPILRSIDKGCSTMLLREPPIRTLAPNPGPSATLALAPT
jgi:hypothetical protein